MRAGQVRGAWAAALGQLAVYVCYADRYVRRCAAARLYEALTLYGDVTDLPPDDLDKVLPYIQLTKGLAPCPQHGAVPQHGLLLQETQVDKRSNVYTYY